MLAPLDNEIIFKKAFQQRDVLIALVKDIIGIDFNPGKIETEKEFYQNEGNIQQRYDIYAESVDHRVIVELQRVEYDYHFDRFLHYHNQAINELQKSYKDYKINKTVYTIVFLTRPYKMNVTKNGRPIEDDVLISDVNPRNLQDKVIDVYGHKLIFLNSFYKKDKTPANYKDWLELIYESIYNPENYNVNKNKKAIVNIVKSIEYEKLSPNEFRLMKVAAGKKAVEQIHLNEIEEERQKAIKAEKEKDKAEKDKDKAEKDKDKAEKDKDKAEKEKDKAEKDKHKAFKLLAAKLDVSIEEVKLMIK